MLYLENAEDQKTSQNFQSDGPVCLYYNNLIKFQTTNTGIDVTGTVTSDGHTTAGDISASGGLSAYNGYFVDKVGIGTNNPSHKLNVAVSDGDDGIVLQKAGTSNDIFRVSMDGTTDQGEMFLYDNAGVTAGTAVLAIRANTNPSYINTAANFGVGTTAPAEKLTVAGNISASGSLSASGSAPNYFAGKVGIGTTDPSEALLEYPWRK